QEGRPEAAAEWREAEGIVGAHPHRRIQQRRAEVAAPPASRRVERPARHRRLRASQREERRQLQRRHLEGGAEPLAEQPEGERRPGGSAEDRRARRRARAGAETGRGSVAPNRQCRGTGREAVAPKRQRRGTGREEVAPKRQRREGGRYKSFCESTLHTAYASRQRSCRAISCRQKSISMTSQPSGTSPVGSISLCSAS